MRGLKPYLIGLQLIVYSWGEAPLCGGKNNERCFNPKIKLPVKQVTKGLLRRNKIATRTFLKALMVMILIFPVAENSILHNIISIYLVCIIVFSLLLI